MLVQWFEQSSFLDVWMTTTFITCFWYTVVSYAAYKFLNQPAFFKYKTQGKLPKSKVVQKEHLEGLLSCAMNSFNVALCLHFSNRSKLVTNMNDLTFQQHLASLLTLFVVTEVFEWTFHWMSHRYDILWMFHKYHHQYPNPTAFAVLSDHPVDMLIKGSPIVWFPFLFPIHDTILIGVFGSINFLFGLYLHAGYELPWLPSRTSKFFNSSWHHNYHHSHHIDGNYGFFTRVLDRIFGTNYDYN